MHESVGMLVFGVTALRLVWRLFAKRPDHAIASGGMKVSSQVVQVSLYVLLFAIALTALAGAWLEGRPLTRLAGVEIAPWLRPSYGLGE